jgi:hypothetical protein
VPRMIRKQVYIGPEHEAALKRRARELGVTESDLIRRGIEQVSRRPLPPDQQAMAEFFAFIRERTERLQASGAISSAPSAGRGWTREELYDRWPPRRPR